MKLNHSTNTWYPANSLYQTTVEDPNGNRSFTFTDKKGRLVLSRRRNNSGTQESNTYNLYDNKDRPTTIIPPDATISNTNLIFKYLYDASDNMTSKDVPDAAAMTMKYDSRNLMTLMQDGNLLAAPNDWLATNYDIYGRPTSTGFVKNTASPSPAGPFTFTTANQLTETIYDDPNNVSAILKGKVKQSKVKILNAANNSFITTEYSYDTHGRVSGTAANNHTGGNDNHAFTYDWADNRLTSTRNHSLTGPTNTTITETTTYDHAGRAKLNKHKLGTAAEVTLSQLNYNTKDELIEKNLGYTSATSTLQSLDYTYNDQGWLTAINQATLVPSGIIGGTTVALTTCPVAAPALPTPGLGTSPDQNDLFYLELRYDNLFSGMTGTLQKNGNIAQMQWRTRGRERQGYRFTYDFLDRLTAANYSDISEAGTVTASNRYNETLTYADYRGNIGTLQRQGAQLNGACWDYAQIDNLTYTYTSGTNRLASIAEAASATYKAKGFNPGNGTGTYQYDANGNMKDDPYKAMTIAYNHLNLPTTINMGGNKTLTNLYNADGVKLRMTVNNNGTITTRDYHDGIEYNSNGIESIYHLEGRLFNNSGTYRYEYAIGDHLGNTRMTFTDKNGNGSIDVSNTSTNEVLQENHYYPFGLNFEGPWMNDNVAADERYQFNGIERVGDLGVNLDLAFFRTNDPAIGRWWQVDPMCEMAPGWTPYRFGFNNPLLYSDPTGLWEETDNGWETNNIEEIKDFINASKNLDYDFSIQRGDGTDDEAFRLISGQGSSVHILYNKSGNSSESNKSRQGEVETQNLDATTTSLTRFISGVTTDRPFNPMEGLDDPFFNLITLGRGWQVSSGRNLLVAGATNGAQKLLSAGAAKLTQEGLEHIVLRHWFTSSAKNAGKFLKGTTARSLKKLLETATTQGTFSPNTMGRPGTIAIYDFGKVIGTDISGRLTSVLKVVIDSKGVIKTAYPF